MCFNDWETLKIISIRLTIQTREEVFFSLSVSVVKSWNIQPTNPFPFSLLIYFLYDVKANMQERIIKQGLKNKFIYSKCFQWTLSFGHSKNNTLWTSADSSHVPLFVPLFRIVDGLWNHLPAFASKRRNSTVDSV